VKIAVGADHAGFEMKSVLLAYIEAEGHQVHDVGAYTREPSDYPDIAAASAQAVLAGADRGVLICGSGVGVSIAANKIHGIRAAVCHDCYSARQGVEHDDMNILVLGSRIIGPELAKTLVSAFLSAHFSHEARHVRRLAKILQLESGSPAS